MKEPTNDDGVGPSISGEDKKLLSSLVTDSSLSAINDVPINKLIASFKESFMGAARVFVLVRDTANKKVPPEAPFAGGYGKQLLDKTTKTNPDHKNLENLKLVLKN